jgi:hypothetical protein
MKLRRLGQAAIVLSGGYLTALAVTRRWHQHWGASDQEITTPLPGDDLIAESKLGSTHAITIHAPADQVWPWLAQLGYEDRAGSYSYDRFERSIGRNLYRVDPDIPPLAPGDTMPFYPGCADDRGGGRPTPCAGVVAGHLGRQGDRPGWTLGRGLRGLVLGVCAGADGCGHDPAAGPHAGQLPAGGQVGTGHVAAGGARPLRQGSPSAAGHPTTRRDRPAP